MAHGIRTTKRVDGFSQKPLPTPDQVRGRLFRNHALVAADVSRALIKHRTILPPVMARAQGRLRRRSQIPRFRTRLERGDSFWIAGVALTVSLGMRVGAAQHQ